MQINGKNVNVKRYSSFEERNVNNVTEPIRATRDDFKEVFGKLKMVR